MSSYDGDLDMPAEPARAEGESAESYEAGLAAHRAGPLADFTRRLVIARETGDWSLVLRPGANPTRFTVRQIPGRQWSQWDRVADGLSQLERACLLLRMALVSATNFVPGFKVGTPVHHTDEEGRKTGLGLIAPVDVIEAFYAGLPGDTAASVIIDLGTQIYNHRTGHSGN